MEPDQPNVRLASSSRTPLLWGRVFQAMGANLPEGANLQYTKRKGPEGAYLQYTKRKGSDGSFLSKI